MQQIDTIRKVLQGIAAQSHGQVPQVRTVQGRQMYFLNQQQGLLLLPHLPADGEALQVLDPEDADFGKSYFLYGISPVDHTDYVLK